MNSGVYKQHAERVNAWTEAAFKGLDSQGSIEMLESTLEVLWNSTQGPLSDVTLSAIWDRVLYNAIERFPMFSGLKADFSGVTLQDGREQLAKQTPEKILEGTRFITTEYISIIGTLTGEVLTPAIYVALSKSALQPRERK